MVCFIVFFFVKENRHKTLDAKTKSLQNILSKEHLFEKNNITNNLFSSAKKLLMAIENYNRWYNCEKSHSKKIELEQLAKEVKKSYLEISQIYKK